MKKLLICCLLLVSSRYTHAQQISPNELFQLFRFWRMNSPAYASQTYDYLQTVDKAWQPRMEPMKENGGLTLLFAYAKDKVWYKDEQHRLFMMYDPNKSPSKCIFYTFTDLESWKIYNQQLQQMNARLVKTVQEDGGTETFYQVSDIMIGMDEFPPGMNGAERQYRVSLIPYK